MARTCVGGALGNGFPAKSASTGGEPLLGIDHESIFLPALQGSEPQVPIESRLIGSENAGSLPQVLRLIAERIWGPDLSVIRALEFDLVSSPSHHREEPISIGDSKRLEGRDGGLRQRQTGKHHPRRLRRDAVEDPRQKEG
jgi:hypothetical protein